MPKHPCPRERPIWPKISVSPGNRKSARSLARWSLSWACWSFHQRNENSRQTALWQHACRKVSKSTTMAGCAELPRSGWHWATQLAAELWGSSRRSLEDHYLPHLATTRFHIRLGMESLLREFWNMKDLAVGPFLGTGCSILVETTYLKRHPTNPFSQNTWILAQHDRSRMLCLKLLQDMLGCSGARRVSKHLRRETAVRPTALHANRCCRR